MRALDSVDRFAASLAHLSWFAALGEEVTPPERRDAADYLAALGFADVAVAGVADWRAAEAVTRDPAWSQSWWQAEEDHRAALLRAAGERHGEHALMTALTRVTSAASDVVLGAAAMAAARDGIADQALARVAAGAATQAAYQVALALAAGADARHPFAVKFRLFAAGRWPLGVVGKSLHLF